MSNYVLEFEIQATPKSPNALLGAHWTVRSTHAKKWERMVWAHVWPRKPKAPLQKALVTLTRCSIRKMDADNARSSFKPVLDALVKLGILVDDNTDVIGEPIVKQEKAKFRQARIIVRVEEIA